MKCPECLKPLSGLYDFNKRCCMVRLVANAPDHARTAHYKAIRERDGDVEVVRFIDEVNAERRRLFDAKVAA